MWARPLPEPSRLLPAWRTTPFAAPAIKSLLYSFSIVALVRLASGDKWAAPE